jgi:pimeloyl-ACP methyl ester carboxylesterase
MRVTMSAGLRLIPFVLVLSVATAMAAVASEPVEPAQSAPQPPPLAAPLVGLADSAGLRATVFGPAPQDMASLPAKVPLSEINAELPWRLPVPQILWFDSKLRVWLSAQDKPAPLAIVIAGTGSDGNTKTISILRAALYGAGYHVLTMPSPTSAGFIVSASSTGVAGDLMRDGKDLYAAMQEIVAHLPRKIRITDIDVLGYSLGGANAAIVKSIDATEHKLKIHRVVMINPPVTLFSSIGRLDRLFTATIGPGDRGVELLYRRLYAQIANLYRASDRLELDENFLLSAGGATLKTDAEFSAAIALTFRLQLVDMFFIGDLYAKTGIFTDPAHPPKVGDSLEDIQRELRAKPFADYFTRVFAPYYLQRRPDATSASLIASNRLDIITAALHEDGDYYAQTSSNDLILNKRELDWLQDTMGSRIIVYDHGGHLGEVGDRQQVADMLAMLSGGWQRSAR